MSARGGPPTDERRSGRGSGGSSNRLGGRFECTDDADLRAVAARHVAHARERYPELRAVDPEVFVGIVVAWLQPLPEARPWLRQRRWQTRPGEPVWVGGAVGLHIPRAREAS